MKLDYNLLWFEDSEEYIKPLKRRIERYLNDLGFTLVLNVEKTGDNLDKILLDTKTDLILMDLYINKGKTSDEDGNSLIKKIRGHELYTEIIFYSGVKNIENSITEHLEGFYLSNRTNLYEKTKKIIYLTVKKQQHITNLRGLFIAATIDMTLIMNDIIINYLKLNKINEIQTFKQNILLKEFYNDYEKYKFIKYILNTKIDLLKNDIEKKPNNKTLPIKLEY